MAKVLIIDDDQDLVEVMSLVLAKAGYQIVTANNKGDGKAAFERENPDVILLDVMMESEDDGFVLAQELRKEGHKTPIIMLTNVSRVLGMEFGKDDEMVPVDEFTEKPLPPDKLLALVKKYAN